jgi:hypothetical protein
VSGAKAPAPDIFPLVFAYAFGSITHFEGLGKILLALLIFPWLLNGATLVAKRDVKSGSGA